jgi:hypothetical protein
MPDRLYCTLEEVITDLEEPGMRDTTTLLAFIRAASDFIDRRGGRFIPFTEALSLDGPGGKMLWVPPLLAVTALSNDGTAVASDQYVLYPRNRHWENGPYTRLDIDPDASALTAWPYEADILLLTGRWGLYDEDIATGATVSNNPLASDGTSLVVSNGALLSPGMVLLIETEQLLLTDYGSPTDSTANLAEDLDASEEAVDVNTGSLLNVGELIRVDLEQMRVLDIASNTLHVLRGYNGTVRTTHSSGADVYAYRTFDVERAISGTTAAAHVQTTAIRRYRPPFDINYLARQMAGLMWKKKRSQWAGKVGNAALGETFYFNEFPRDPLKEIMRNYRARGGTMV